MEIAFNIVGAIGAVIAGYLGWVELQRRRSRLILEAQLMHAKATPSGVLAVVGFTFINQSDYAKFVRRMNYKADDRWQIQWELELSEHDPVTDINIYHVGGFTGGCWTSAK